MDPHELNEKLRKEVLANLVGLDREKVLAEIDDRESYISNVEKGPEVRCSCGLVMPRRSFYEHRKETKHEESKFKEKIEKCSCGLMMSSTNLREHQIETNHSPMPQVLKQERKPQRIPGTRPAGVRPAINFQFDTPDNLD